MKDFRSIKIRVTPETSKLVQEKFFDAGVAWGDGTDHAQCTDEPYLEVSSYGILFYIRNDKEFQESELDEITVEDVLGVKLEHKYKTILEAMIEGKAIESWEPVTRSWVQRSQFDIFKGMSRGVGADTLRVKPKTKVIKQWEQKVLVDYEDRVETLTSLDKENFFINDGWTVLGKPYEKEYEVPDEI